MSTEDPLAEFATITTAATPGPLPSDTRDPFHRTTAGPSRILQTQQSDALLSRSTSIPPQRPPLNRGQSQMQQAFNSAAKFVGLPYAEKSPDLSEWDSRRLRFLNKRYKLKDSVIDHVQRHHEVPDSVLPSITPTAETPSGLPAGSAILARTPSMESRPRLEKKDSVVKVVYDTVSSFIKRGTISRPKPRHAPLSARSSFDAADLDFHVPTSIHPTIPTVPEEPSDIVEEEEESSEQEPVVDADTEWVEMRPLERPTSLSGSTRPLSPFRRSFRPPGFESLPVICDDEGNPVARPRHCFAQLRVTSEYPSCPLEPDKSAEPDDAAIPKRKSKSWTSSTRPEATPLREDLMDSQKRTHIEVPYSGLAKIDFGSSTIHPVPKKTSLGPKPKLLSVEPDRISRKPSTLSRQDAMEQDGVKMAVKLLDNIAKSMVPYKRKPRYRGVGPIGRLFNHHLVKPEVKKLNPQFQEVLERGEDHRPFFTYWVTTVQILVCMISLITYNFGTWGFFERVERSDEVQDTSLALRRVSFYEPTNIWLGPSIANLVRLGAKYSPCMRREKGAWKDIEEERKKENKTACCIFNDRSGCYQTSEKECPRDLAIWEKWPKHYGNSSKRTAGSVCGQDPHYCRNPQSIAPKEWEDDLTKWPICKMPRVSNNQPVPDHMICQITGRPCCIQMQGLCRITTRDYCAFVQGTWHSEATLCSQVDCFGDICGMLPFFIKDHPNQFYRLFTSLFIHAGLAHLSITLAVHYFFLSDLEALIGWKRMALVYLGSGVGGNLASAIFVPYNPEVGPSGSQVGIFAALIVDVIHHRKWIRDWKHALGEHIFVVALLMIAGLVPFIDNWAHIFGFIFGLLITLACFPYVNFSGETALSTESDQRREINYTFRRKCFVWASIILGTALFILLGYVYFANVQIDCPYCSYLNCVNFLFLDHYCDNKGLELTHWLPI